MIIQDQNGTGILFSENVMGLGVKKNENSDKKDKNPDLPDLFVVMSVPILSTEPNVVLGLYTTQQRAEEVLYSIRNAMASGEPLYLMPLD